MQRWALLFAALTAALCVALAFVLRENRLLREQVQALVREKARAVGLVPGQTLAAVTLHDAAGRDVHLDFASEFLGTVLFFHASGCGACANTRPLWSSAIAAAGRPDVRVVCIQTDVLEGAPLALEGLPPSLAVPLPPEGWLASLPAVPATLVLDEHGVLTRAWFDELDAAKARELTEAIAGLGSTASATR
jgi:peroxiredoxin